MYVKTRHLSAKEIQELDTLAQKNNMSREQLVTDILRQFLNNALYLEAHKNFIFKNGKNYFVFLCYYILYYFKDRRIILMTNYVAKEEKVIEKISKTIEKLDSDLEKLDSINEDGRKHHFKKWRTEKKAFHEIKRLLHEIGKYDKYDEKELEKFEKLEKELLD